MPEPRDVHSGDAAAYFWLYMDRIGDAPRTVEVKKLDINLQRRRSLQHLLGVILPSKIRCQLLQTIALEPNPARLCLTRSVYSTRNGKSVKSVIPPCSSQVIHVAAHQDVRRVVVRCWYFGRSF